MHVYEGDVSDMKTIKGWHDKLLAMGSILKPSGDTCQSVSKEKVK